MKRFGERMGRATVTGLGILALMAGLGGAAMAGHHGTPEMDPGSMANALLVLSSGLLILRGRRPRK